MEVPGLTLAISSDKTAIKKDETVQLFVKLQYAGKDRVLMEKPDSNLLWLFHPEVKVPLPASIPFARTALPTPEGVRLLRSGALYKEIRLHPRLRRYFRDQQALPNAATRRL
jgi:hypothetical protein